MWDIRNYLLEAENQFNDTSVYKSIELKGKVLADLAESSNKMFWDLETKGLICQKELQYFTCKFK